MCKIERRNQKHFKPTVRSCSVDSLSQLIIFGGKARIDRFYILDFPFFKKIYFVPILPDVTDRHLRLQFCLNYGYGMVGRVFEHHHGVWIVLRYFNFIGILWFFFAKETLLSTIKWFNLVLYHAIRYLYVSSSKPLILTYLTQWDYR